MLLLEEGKDYDNVDDTKLPYKHIRNLGHGHSGVVEEVVDEVTQTVYARKTIWLPASRASKKEQTKVFHNEIKIIRGLGNHRHIIKIFTTYMTRRHVCLILQPVASEGDLETFLAEYWSDVRHMEETNEPNPRLEAMVPIMERAFGCLAVGLAFIHEKKVRHKDVKPKNILVHNGLVIYTDFGYSLDSSAFSRSTTEGRPNALTRKYSAPEVIDHEERNSKSDVFSLGCVFIDLLGALTLGMDPDEVRCYSESLLDLHDQLTSWATSPRQSSLPKIITAMTTRDASKRLCAIHAATEILHLDAFCCPECRSSPVEAWKKKFQGDQRVKISEETKADQIEPADENIVNDERKDFTSKQLEGGVEKAEQSVEEHTSQKPTPQSKPHQNTSDSVGIDLPDSISDMSISPESTDQNAKLKSHMRNEAPVPKSKFKEPSTPDPALEESTSKTSSSKTSSSKTSSSSVDHDRSTSKTAPTSKWSTEIPKKQPTSGDETKPASERRAVTTSHQPPYLPPNFLRRIYLSESS